MARESRRDEYRRLIKQEPELVRHIFFEDDSERIFAHSRRRGVMPHEISPRIEDGVLIVECACEDFHFSGTCFHSEAWARLEAEGYFSQRTEQPVTFTERMEWEVTETPPARTVA